MMKFMWGELVSLSNNQPGKPGNTYQMNQIIAAQEDIHNTIKGWWELLQ